MKKTITYFLVAFATALGGISLLLFALFLFFGSFNIVNLDLNLPMMLLLNSLLSFAFFIQHSVMIRKSFRPRVKIHQDYYGVFFTISSSVVLLFIVMLWPESEYTLLNIQGFFRWLLRAIYFFSIIGLTWGVRALGSFDIFGTKPLLARLRNKELTDLPFTIRGPYRWIPHPLYFFVLLLIWSYPNLSIDRLLFNILWTGWIFWGTVSEERDLVDHFGDVYRNYQKSVPMLIPYKFPSSKASKNS